MTLAQLGFQAAVEDRLHGLIRRPQGMLLSVGPTGSGKTTTLYAFVNEIRREPMNIVTIEDPVEYEVDGISQVPVNEKTGLTFSKSLRSILRQDPDVILVGEIRDSDTALTVCAEALRLLEEAVGPDHPDVANVLNTFAAIHLDLDQYATAEALCRRSVGIMEQEFGADL